MTILDNRRLTSIGIVSLADITGRPILEVSQQDSYHRLPHLFPFPHFTQSIKADGCARSADTPRIAA